MSRLLDLSHYQTSINWDKIKDKVILKCSESTNYLDPTFKARQAEARKRGLYLGCYHFARSNNYKAEVNWFLKNADFKEGDILFLDAETNQTPTWCEHFLDLLPGKPMLYAPVKNWAVALNYPLWVARYGPNNGQMNLNFPPQIGKWKDWTIWQYTSAGKVDGISGNVDLNEMKTPPEAIPEPPKPISPVGENGFMPGKFKYINQLDPKWRNLKIGNSTSTIGNYGCTISAISMFSSYAGCFHDPSWMSKNLQFAVDKVIWQSIEKVLCFKFSYRYYSFNQAVADDALKDERKGVLFNIMNGKHWVLGLSKTDLGYVIANPLGGTKEIINANSIVGMTTLII